MAHWKRRKCRKSCPKAIRGSVASWRAKVGLIPVRIGDSRVADVPWHQYRTMMKSYPAWWDRTFHTPPFRAANRKIERAIMRGADPDAIELPVWGRPHKYYW